MGEEISHENSNDSIRHLVHPLNSINFLQSMQFSNIFLIFDNVYDDFIPASIRWIL